MIDLTDEIAEVISAIRLDVYDSRMCEDDYAWEELQKAMQESGLKIVPFEPRLPDDDSLIREMRNAGYENAFELLYRGADRLEKLL